MSAEKQPQNPPVLVIEDNDDDFEFATRVFKDIGLSRPIHRCANVKTARNYLNQNTTKPALVLLDLNLPDGDGREIITHIKEDDKLRAVPVVVLTTSNNPSDVKHCYHIGANSYVRKALKPDDFRQDMRLLFDYWFKANVLP